MSGRVTTLHGQPIVDHEVGLRVTSHCSANYWLYDYYNTSTTDVNGYYRVTTTITTPCDYYFLVSAHANNCDYDAECGPDRICIYSSPVDEISFWRQYDTLPIDNKDFIANLTYSASGSVSFPDGSPVTPDYGLSATFEYYPLDDPPTRIRVPIREDGTFCISTDHGDETRRVYIDDEQFSYDPQEIVYQYNSGHVGGLDFILMPQ